MLTVGVLPKLSNHSLNSCSIKYKARLLEVCIMPAYWCISIRAEQLIKILSKLQYDQVHYCKTHREVLQRCSSPQTTSFLNYFSENKMQKLTISTKMVSDIAMSISGKIIAKWFFFPAYHSALVSTIYRAISSLTKQFSTSSERENRFY